MHDPLPVIGASMQVAQLAENREWLIDGRRDLEIRDAAVQPGILDGDWRSLALEARELLDGHKGRRGMHAPAADYTIKAVDPKARALIADRLLQSLEFGFEIGSSHMVIHSPFHYLSASPSVTPRSGLDEEIALVHATLERVVPAAQQAGCTLVIENTHDTNPALLLALVRSFDSEHVRMSLDTGHAFVTSCTGGPPPDQWVREAGPLLGDLHLEDTDGFFDRHWVPGDGEVNWFALFQALGELEHRPRLVIEVSDPSPQNLDRATAWLADRWFVREYFVGGGIDEEKPASASPRRGR